MYKQIKIHLNFSGSCEEFFWEWWRQQSKRYVLEIFILVFINHSMGKTVVFSLWFKKPDFLFGNVMFPHMSKGHCRSVEINTWKKARPGEELSLSFQFIVLRANVCNFRESVDSREFLNFFIYCPNNLYSTLISKITLKLVTAFYFFRNQAKFEKL